MPTKPSFRDLGGLVGGQEGEAGGFGVRESRTGPPWLSSRLGFVLAAGCMRRQRGSLMAQSRGSAGAPRGLCACVTKRKRRGSYSLISNPGLKTQLCPQGGDLGQVPSQI